MSTKTQEPIRRPAGVDTQWQEKIDLAKRARREGREIRKDKSPAFQTRRFRLSNQQTKKKK